MKKAIAVNVPRQGHSQCRPVGLTGITRGKRLVMLVGRRKALAIAVRNNKTEQRFSGLLARLSVPS